MRNIFIGVAWPYVNGRLHIGHLAGYLLPADICSRYHRAIGNNVLMVSGSDCFGTPTTVEADKKGVSPKEIADLYHKDDVDLFLNTLNLTYDLYTRTDNLTHEKVTQDIFISLLENGYIFKDTTLQYYSSENDRFLPDRYVEGECPFCHFKESRSDQCDNCGKLINQGELINPISKISGSPVEFKETEHYFVDWSKLQPQLEKYVAESSQSWKEWVLKETEGWLAEGLKPRAVTRDLDWGVEIPWDRIPQELHLDNKEGKRFYVWFDAVIGYLSASIKWSEEVASEKEAWKRFWYDSHSENDLYHYYFMGQDNLVFHTLFWPGKLEIHDENLHKPDQPSINKFLNLNGAQFSKSRGVVVDIKDMVEEFGNDAVRFYLTLIMPETKSSNFVWSDFEEKNNGILVGTIGNFIHRSLSLGFDQPSDVLQKFNVSEEVILQVKDSFESALENLEKCRFRNYLDDVISLASYGNKFIDERKLWELKKTDPNQFSESIKSLYFIVLSLAYLFYPLLPHASSKLLNLTGAESSQSFLWPDLSDIEAKSSFKLSSKPEILFKKIELGESE